MRASSTCCTTACPASRWHNSLWSKSGRCLPKMHLFIYLMGVARDRDRPQPSWVLDRCWRRLGWHHGGSEQVVPSFDSFALISDKVAARVSGDLTIVENHKKKRRLTRRTLSKRHHDTAHEQKTSSETHAQTQRHCHDLLSTDADMPSAPQTSNHRTQKKHRTRTTLN